MEYQKIINLLDDATNQPSKFRKRNWVEINDESQGTSNNDNNNNNNNNNNIKFKMSMRRSNLCDYSDAHMHVKKRTIIAPNTNKTNKKVIFKNCARFTDNISEISNTQVDNAQDIDILMPMYNLIECSGAYSKTSERLWQYCIDEPALDNNKNIIDFSNINNSISLKFKLQITRETGKLVFS